MKNPERVAELIAELKNECEYRFEFDAVAALAQTVNEQPRVIIIDDNYQSFNGLNYRKRKYGHFYRGRGQALHRDVWQHFFGDIPVGYEIHHIDGDKANNDISNLKCLPQSEHRKLHAPDHVPLIFETFTCINCGKTYTARSAWKNCFCSKKCHYQYHTEERMCSVCGKKFKGYEYRGQKFCSRECASKARTLAAMEKRTCPECGQTFIAKKSEAKICCSRKCARAHRKN